MKSKSKNKQKRLFILGSSGAIIAGSIAAGLTVGAGVPSTLPNGITNQADYFTDSRNKAVDKVITQIGLNQDSFLAPTENENFQQIKKWHQFSVIDSTVTIDDLIQRLQLLQSIGIYGYNNDSNSIQQISLDNDIRALQKLKADSLRDAADPVKVREAYRGAANVQKAIFESLVPAVDINNKSLVLRRKQDIMFYSVKALWDRSQSAFKDFAFDYIQAWVRKTAHKAMVDRKELNITLAKLSPDNNNLVYDSGALFGEKNSGDWNSLIGNQIVNNTNGNFFTKNGNTDIFRFLSNGTFILHGKASAAKQKRDIIFVKQNLTPADFMIFNLVISGQFNSDSDLDKLTKSHLRDHDNVSLSVPKIREDNIGGGNVTIYTSKFLNQQLDQVKSREAMTDLQNEFQSRYFNRDLFWSIRNNSVNFQFTDSSGTHTYTEPYSNVINDAGLPDPSFYLASANQSPEAKRAAVIRQYEQKARKYFIERFYAGSDNSLLQVNNIKDADALAKARLNNTQKQKSLYLDNTNNAYSIINKTTFISHLENGRANSLSYKWFVTTHFNKNGRAIALQNDNRQNYEKIRDWKFRGSNGTDEITSTEGDDVFRNSNDRMIYDYIEYVARINHFSLDDPNANEIFKNLYRLIRSTVTFENSWTAARDDSGTGADSVKLNGYNQDETKLAHSSILTITSSMVVKYYQQLVASIQSAIVEASATYAKNPSVSQLNTLLNIYNFFQLYINPLQFSVDDPSVSPIDNRYLGGRKDIWPIFTRFLSTNFPNFGAAVLDGTKLTNPNDVLTGNSVPFARESDSEFLHSNLLAKYKTINSFQPYKDWFESFWKWFFDVKLRKGIAILVNRAKPATASTNDIDKVNIFGSEFTIDPRYPLGKTLAAIEYTNSAVLSPQRGSVDHITNEEFGEAAIRSSRYVELGLPENFNTNKDINDSNRPILTREYFSNKVRYNTYLKGNNGYVARLRENSLLAPLAPIVSSNFYNGSYKAYSNDYNDYIGAFYKNSNNRSGDIKFNFQLPTPPQIYTNLTSENSNDYFRNYASYLDVLKKYYKIEVDKRNKALKNIQNISLLTPEDTSFRATLKNGTVITDPNNWLDDSFNPKITADNPITKIEAGPRHVIVPLNSPFIKWKAPGAHQFGFDQILPGPNGITNDPEDLSKKITTRNLLIRQLQRSALQEYRNLYTQVNAWYISIRSEIKPSQINTFNQQINELNHMSGKLAQIDGYTIKQQTGVIDFNSDYPWDSATADSSNLISTSFFSKMNDFIASVSAARNGSTSRNEKVRSLTIDLIKKASGTSGAEFSSAKTLLTEFLNGSKTVDSSGNVVTAITATPLRNDFPQAAIAATQAMNAADALRSYVTNVGTFDNYTSALNRVTDSEYHQTLSTVTLIYQYGRFNSHVFNYDSSSSTPQFITKAKWGFRQVNFTADDLSNSTKYNAAVDSKTEANTALRFFYKFFSPTDPDSAQTISDRDAAIAAVQDLYSRIGNPGTAGSFSYDPSANSTQASIDSGISGLTGDIAHILPNDRAILASKYHEAVVALDRIRVQTANLTALRNTKAALDYAYRNARLSVGKYNRNTLEVIAGYWPHFHFRNGDTSVGTTRTGGNPEVQIINRTISSIDALDPYPSVQANKEDYLAAMDVMSELLYLEQQVVSSKNLTFSREKFIELDKKLVKISENIDTGFSSKPWYSDITNATVARNYQPIKNADLRNVLLRKIQYIQYLGGAYLIKDNYIPKFDIDNGEIDPVYSDFSKKEWAQFLLKIKQQGNSTVSYRELSSANQKLIDDLMTKIYPVLRRPNDPEDPNSTNPMPRPHSYVDEHLPTFQTVNDLRSLIELLNNNKNNTSLLQSEYSTDAALKPSLLNGANPKTPAAAVFASVIDQTKNFLDIQNAVNNSNPSFTGLPAIADADRAGIVSRTYNEFKNSDITDQLQKLQNAKTLSNILERIKTFRDQYTTIGVGGVAGKTPAALQSTVSPTLYKAWEKQEAIAKALFDNGTIPGYSKTFVQINNELKGVVNINPDLTTVGDKSSLTPVVFTGLELIKDFSTISTALNNLQANLFNATNALTNTVSSNQLVPLLNELNGNPTTITNGNNVYIETANQNNPNNAVYAVNPSSWNSAITSVPAIENRIIPTPGSASLTEFNSHFAPTNAFIESNRGLYNTYPYEDLLESKTQAGRGPTSLKKDSKTTQTDINTVVSYLNGKMTEQVMNAIYWANTDFLILNKMDEFLFQTEDSKYSLNDGTKLLQKKNEFSDAFNKTKQFFETELAKTDSKYVKVASFNPTADLHGKIPLLNFEAKMSAYSQAWKDLLLKNGNSSEALRTDFRNKGLVLETLAKLASATDTNSRASFISAYKDYIAARNNLNGTLSQISYSIHDSLGTVFTTITSSIDSDWLTRKYTRQNDITLQNVLKRAQILIEENGANKFVTQTELSNTVEALKKAFAAKQDADTATRVEVVSRLPQLTDQIISTLKNTTMSFGAKEALLTTQVSTLADAIGVRKVKNTGIIVSDGSYLLANYEDDPLNFSGVVQTFATIDRNLVKVARTYSKTLQYVDVIISYMKAIDAAQNDPNQSKSNLFAAFNTALNSAAIGTDFATAQANVSSLLATKVVNGVTSSVSSETDKTTLHNLFDALGAIKTSLPTSAANVKAVVDKIVDAKTALDNLLNDTSAVYETGSAITAREALIASTKAKVDEMINANLDGLIVATDFNRYKDQLKKYWKALLTLEKVRNLFIIVLNKTDTPNTRIENDDLSFLYNQYTEFLAKRQTLSAVDPTKTLFHMVKQELLDPTKRAKLLTLSNTWLTALVDAISAISSNGNPNAIPDSMLDKFRTIEEKVASGYTFINNFLQYEDSDFAGDPTTNINKVNLPNNVGFDLDSGIKGYRKGTDIVSDATFTSLSNTIKQLVAFNGLFNINTLPANPKLGAVSLLLKNPVLSQLDKIKALANEIKNTTLTEFDKAVKAIPAELLKSVDLTSWSVTKFLDDLEKEAKVNLLKVELITKLDTYLRLDTDAAKTDLVSFLNTFDSTTNKALLSSILPTDNDPIATKFRADYIHGLKQMATKVSKIGDEFNNVDKVIIGQRDPGDNSVTVTKANQNQLRNKYLDVALAMVDGTLDDSEITNLDSWIPDATVKDFILKEVNLQAIKDEIKLKIERKRFEVNISMLKNLDLAQYTEQNGVYKAVNAGLTNPNFSDHLKAFANLVFAQKDLEVGYYAYVRNVGSINRANLFALERRFLVIKNEFKTLESQKSSWSASEQVLYDEITTDSNTVLAESQVVTSLQQYAEVPNNTNKAAFDAKLAAASTSTNKDLFTQYIIPAKELTDKVNAYWNNENDITSATSSNNNTVDSANQLLNEINVKVNVVAGQTVSPYFTTLQQTLTVLKSGVASQQDISNFLDYNANALPGDPSYDPITKAVYSKSTLRNRIIESDLNVVDSDAAIAAQTTKHQATALNELLNIVTIIQSTTDFLSSGAIGSNYLGNPRDLTSAAYAYSGPLGIKSIFDKFVTNSKNWTDLIINNSYSRLHDFANGVLEKIKILNQLSKVIYLFSAASSHVTGTNAELIPSGENFYDAFVKEYAILKTDFQKFASLPKSNPDPSVTVAATATTPADATTHPLAKLFNANTDFWRLFERSFTLIDAVHNDQKTGALDLLDDFLVHHINDTKKESEARDVIIKVFNYQVAGKINNDSYTDLAALLLSQLSNTSVLVQVTTNIRRYYENRMEQGYRNYLGTYGAETKIRIESAINNIISQFGTADGKTDGRSWNVEINLALGTNPTSLAKLKGAFRSMQNYIDSILALQLVVDKYVKDPTEENRKLAINNVLWANLNKYASEVETLAKTKPNAIFSQGLISFAQQLAKLKDVQANKMRLAQGLLVATQTTDLTKINFESVNNPFADERSILGNTFNLYTALGAQKTADGLITPVALDGSLLFGATRYRFSSDALIYELLNLINPKASVDQFHFTTDGKDNKSVTINVIYPGKNSNYLPNFVEVQRAFNNYYGSGLYEKGKATELQQFKDGLAPLLTKIKKLNLDPTAIDADKDSLYAGIKILLPPATEATESFNFEKHLSFLVVSLQKQVEYDQAVNAFIVNPTPKTYEQLQTARKDLAAARANIKEIRSAQQITAETDLDKTLDILNSASIAFDAFKAQPSADNLAALTQKTSEFQAQTTEFEKQKANLISSRKGFVDQAKEKAASFNIQIDLIKAASAYTLVPSAENKGALENQIKKIEAIPDVNNPQSQEAILLNEIVKVKSLADKVLPLKTAYEASDFNGVLTDRLLKQALDEYETLKTQNKDVPLIVALLTRVQIPLKTLESNREIDRSLTDYVSALSQKSKDDLAATITKSKQLVSDVTKAQVETNELPSANVDEAVKELSASIPSQITLQYIKAADEAFEAFKLYEQYKVTPNENIRPQILREVDRAALLNEAARHLSLGIANIYNTEIPVDSKLQELATAYDNKYTADSGFGSKTLNEINALIANLKAQKDTLTQAFGNAKTALDTILASESPQQAQIAAARKTLSDAQIALKKFTNLTLPFTEGQKLINPLITQRLEAIQSQILTVNFLRSYVTAKKDYAVKIYAVGKQLIQARDQIQRLGILIANVNIQISEIQRQITTVKAIVNPDAATSASLVQLEQNLATSQSILATSQQQLTEAKRSETALLAQLKTDLDASVLNLETLRTQVLTAAKGLLTHGQKIDAEALKSGNTEQSRETKLATQTLNTVVILEDLKNVLSDYFLNQIKFVTVDYAKVSRYAQDFDQMRKDQVTIIPKDTFDNISLAIAPFANDLTAYAADNNYIIDQNEKNKGEFALQNQTNNTAADINKVLESLVKVNSALNDFKNNLRTENVAPVDAALNEYVTILSGLVGTSFLNNNQLTSLTSLYKNQIVQRVEQMLRGKFDILKAINTYLISPNETNSKALIDTAAKYKPLESQSEEIFKVDVLVRLAGEIKSLNSVVGILTTAKKEGLGDKVEALIQKSIADPTSVTTDELTSIRSQLITGDKSAPLGVIKQRLLAIINKLSADSRSALLIKELKDSGSKISDISIRYDKDPQEFINNDNSNIQTRSTNRTSIIDKAIVAENSKAEEELKAAQAKVTEIEAKKESDRTDVEKATLAENKKIVDLTAAAKKDLDAKRAIVAASTKELEAAKTERDKIFNKSQTPLSTEEKAQLKAAQDKVFNLQKALREKQIAKATTDAQIKILENKKVFILTDAEKARLAKLKDTLQNTLTPQLAAAQQAENDAKAELKKVIDAKAKSVLSETERTALDQKIAGLDKLEKDLETAQAALKKNRDDTQNIVLTNATLVLGERAHREYLNKLNAINVNKDQKSDAVARLSKINEELAVLNAKGASNLTNADREKIVALNSDKNRVAAEIAIYDAQAERLRADITSAERTIVAGLTGTQKTNYDNLVTATPALSSAVQNAIVALNAGNSAVTIDEAKVIASFSGNETNVYNAAKSALAEAQKQKTEVNLKLTSNAQETKALENIVENSLTTAQKAKLVELNKNATALATELKTAQDALNTNNEVIDKLTKKGNAALTDVELKSLKTASATVVTVENRLVSENNAAAVALNTFITAENDAKKAVADAKVAAKNAEITVKESQIKFSLLDESEAGKAKTVELNKELKKLQDELTPLKTAADALNVTKLNIQSLVEQRTKTTDETAKLIGINNAEAKKLQAAKAAGSSISLAQVVSVIADENAKESTATAKEAGVADAIAKSHEDLVKVISDRNELGAAKEALENDPTTQNSTRLLKAIDSVTASNTTLNNEEILNSLSTTLRQIANEAIKANSLDKLENDIIKAAYNAFKLSNQQTIAALNKTIADAKAGMTSANAALEQAKALKEDDTTKAQKVKDAEARVTSATEAENTAQKFARYGRTLDMLSSARTNISVEPKTNSATLDSIDADLALFNDDDAVPILKLARDAARLQIKELRSDVVNESLNVALDAAAKKYIADATATNYNGFVEALSAATDKSTKEAAQYTSVHKSLNMISAAIDTYGKSDVAVAETIATATKSINDAKAQIDADLALSTTTDAAKAILNAAKTTLDSLLANLQQADSKQAEVRGQLNDAIMSYTIGASAADLDNLNKVIVTADASRVNTNAIKGLLETQKQIDSLNDLVAKLKTDISDTGSKDKLIAELKVAKEQFAKTKELAAATPQTKTLSDIVQLKLNDVETDAGIFNGNADDRALSISIDTAVSRNDAASGKTTIADIQSLKESVNSLKATSPEETAVKNLLLQKVSRAENEVLARNAIEALDAAPSADKINALETFINNSMGNYANLVAGIQLNNRIRSELEEFRKLNYNDSTISNKIVELRDLSTLSLKNTETLTNSPNATIKAYATKALPTDQLTKESVDAETTLYEGITQVNQAKVNEAQKMFEKIYSSMATNSKDQYEKLFKSLHNWEHTVQMAKTGNIRAILDIENIKDVVNGLNTVSNISTSGIISEADKYSLGNSTQWKAAVGGLSASAIIAAAAASIFGFLRWRRRKKAK